MSVLQIPILVTRTLTAPIMTVRTAVPANRGSLETGRLVKVIKLEVSFRTSYSLKEFKYILVRELTTIPFYLSFHGIRH